MSEQETAQELAALYGVYRADLLRFLTAPVHRGFVPRLFDFDGPAMCGFPGSWPVTPDGSIVALPTPGHSPGHTSFLLRRAEGDVLRNARQS